MRYKDVSYPSGTSTSELDGNACPNSSGATSDDGNLASEGLGLRHFVRTVIDVNQIV
jgi:hypothetical protein